MMVCALMTHRVLHMYLKDKYQSNPKPYYDCNMDKIFGERVKLRRKELKLSQEKLAKLAGVSQTTIAQIERGRNEASTRILEIARALGVRAEWLSDERADKFPAKHISAGADLLVTSQNGDLIAIAEAKVGPNISGKNETKPGPELQGKVPLISWDRARTWDLSMHAPDETAAGRWLFCPAEHSAATFCLENNTDTMDDGARGSYREGEILFVDPLVPPGPERDVIVDLPNGRVVFRRLKEDSEGIYLLALNGRRIERWQDGMRVRGVVIFSGMFR
jgi:transcriptional regulator with XRE-family HTH domain